MKLYLVYLLCTLLAYGECLPDNFISCKRSDPEIENCILNGVEALKPKLGEGIPEINLPPLDPFKMDFLNINSTITGAKMKAVITDIVARGGSDFTIKYLKVDLDNKYAADLELVFPLLHVTADYNTKGSRMLFFSVSGRGKFKGIFSNVSVVAKCTASPVIKDDVEYLQVDSVLTKVLVGEGDLEVNPIEWSLTGSAASSFIKSSPSVVLNIFAPVIDEVTASLVKKYLNDVLSAVPLKEVLLD